MGLTELETRVLKAASKESGRRLTVEELSKKVGCSPGTIYQRLQNKEFRQLFMETMRNSVAEAVPEVLNAFSDKAKEGEFKHGKLLLEIAGIYEEKKNITAEVGITEESPFKDEKESKEFLKKTLAKAISEEESE